jgi:hypothetical protein
MFVFFFQTPRGQCKSVMTKLTWIVSFLLCCMKTCYIVQLKLQLVATKSSTNVFIVLFSLCLKVDYSQTL